MEVIVGTAGHIDHGKTALVKALTGVDADRLPEEKRRGITVDLGFAEMSIGDVHFGFVDVPGHEKFVKNMLAGASGVDVVLLVVAADEGVMPQTREHFDICRLLGIRHGIVVLTKSDLVDAETLELAKMEVAELVEGSFLADAPVISVSARTGEGIEDLKAALRDVSGSIVSRNTDTVTRLPIDRSFSVKGFGAVVTGTLASGEIVEGQDIELLPDRKRVRVRGLQTHGQTVKRAAAGQRVAVNLGGIDHSRVSRGMVLVEPETIESTQIFDSLIEVLAGAVKPLRSRQRVRVHMGTIEVLARIQVLNEAGEIEPGKTDLAQLRLEMPVVAVPGERFIIRRYSPQMTIAGGEVLDPLAAKHRRKDLDHIRERLSDLLGAKDDHERTVEIVLNGSGAGGVDLKHLQMRTGLSSEVLKEAIRSAVSNGKITQAGGILVDSQRLSDLSASAISELEKFHKQDPLAKGLSRERIREAVFPHVRNEIFETVLDTLARSGKIVADKDMIRLASHRAELSDAEAKLRDRIINIYQAAGLEVPKLDEALSEAAGTGNTSQQARRFLQMLVGTGEIIKVTDDLYFSRAVIDDLITRIRQVVERTGDRVIDVAKFKEISGVSRKYAIPLLEYLDREHVTARAGDKRVVI
jgi:selenocysteine-specific elongation factor